MSSVQGLLFDRISKRIEQLFAIREGGRNPWDYVDKKDEFDMHCINAMYIRLNNPTLPDKECYVSAVRCTMSDSSCNGEDSDTDSDYSWAEFNSETKAMQLCEGGESEIESGTESDSDVY